MEGRLESKMIENHRHRETAAEKPSSGAASQYLVLLSIWSAAFLTNRGAGLRVLFPYPRVARFPLQVQGNIDIKESYKDELQEDKGWEGTERKQGTRKQSLAADSLALLVTFARHRCQAEVGHLSYISLA